MARIRTIKPEFFTSEDIVARSPMARLLYIALWCEADKEGRLVWKPATFKLRYLPGDNCDVQAIAAELVDAGLVVLYGDKLAYIPSFGDHQHINPRESASTLPEPVASPRVRTRRDASPRVSSGIDPQVGREGKGKEGKEKTRDASDVPEWVPDKEWADFETHRKAMRGVPFTHAARQGVIRELEKLKNAGHDPATLLVTAVVRGWRTVFEPKVNGHHIDIAHVTVTSKAADETAAYLRKEAEHAAAVKAERLRKQTA